MSPRTWDTIAFCIRCFLLFSPPSCARLSMSARDHLRSLKRPHPFVLLILPRRFDLPPDRVPPRFPVRFFSHFDSLFFSFRYSISCPFPVACPRERNYVLSTTRSSVRGLPSPVKRYHVLHNLWCHFGDSQGIAIFFFASQNPPKANSRKRRSNADVLVVAKGSPPSDGSLSHPPPHAFFSLPSLENPRHLPRHNP